MPLHLLDVNVLVALAWANHLHHAKAHAWFSIGSGEGWATCPITQTGFIRLCCNPKVVQAPLKLPSAVATLDRVLSHPDHVFWPDILSARDAFSNSTMTGYRQVTDAYLAVLARHHGGTFVTIDRAIRTFGSHVIVI